MTPQLLRFGMAAALSLHLAAVAQTVAAPTRPVPLEQVANDLGATVEGQANGYVVLTTPHRQAILIPDVRRVSLNGLNVYLNAPYTRNVKGGFLAEVDLETVLWPLFTEGTELAWPSDPLIVIDPGHGGMDSGAPGRHKLLEKNLTLDLAKRLEAQLTRAGLRVRLTREDDRALTLAQRARLLQDWDGDLFISIHLNASASSSASGVETYVMPAAGHPSTSNGTRGDREYPGNHHDAENTRLGYFLQKGLVFATRTDDRGVRRARFDVLRNAHCPAALVECGFVTNSREAKRLGDPAYLARIAQGLASGIFTYVNRRETGPIRVSPTDPRSRPARPPASPAAVDEPADPDPAESDTVPMWDTPTAPPRPRGLPSPPKPPAVSADTNAPTPVDDGKPQASPVVEEPAAPLRIAPVNPDTTTNAAAPFP